MNTFLTSLFILLVLLLGSYGIAIIELLLVPGSHRVRVAFWLPLAGALLLLRQGDVQPRAADTFLFRSAPFIAIAVVALISLVIPVGPHQIGINSQIGLFYFIVLLSPFVIAMMNAGWSQNAKEGLFATFRAAATLISYEVPIGFAAIGPVIAAQSLSTERIVQAQASLWYVVWQPLGLVIYLVAALFISFRHPFDGAQAGSELEGGALGEYSGARLLLFKLALNALFLLLMSMGVVLFFGGWQGPWFPGPIWFLLKTAALSALVLWVTRFFPRLRHDQMLTLSWKVLLPASLFNITLVGVLALLLPGGH
ncbi:MAG: NADH-quinone oxidoreductase subunit H [Ktedonobacteraceae bacterium]|nr:NADH-quinone oxidoreductase subunit H [Ktedonobacteraceae bacterium]